MLSLKSIKQKVMDKVVLKKMEKLSFLMKGINHLSQLILLKEHRN